MRNVALNALVWQTEDVHICLHPIYYRCEKQDRVLGRPRCRPNHIRSEPLDKLVWQEIRRYLLNPELLLKAQAMVKETQYLDQSFLGIQIHNAKKRIEKLQAQRRRLIDMFQEGFIFREEFEGRMANLSKRIEEMKSDLVNLELEYKNASDGKQFLSRIKDFTSTVTKNIDRMSFFQKQKLIRTIVQEVVIHYNVVKIYVKIPLPKLKTDALQSKRIQSENKVSSELFLRSRSEEKVQVWVKIYSGPKRLYHGDNPGRNLFADGGLQVFAKRLLAAETKTAEKLTGCIKYEIIDPKSS